MDDDIVCIPLPSETPAGQNRAHGKGHSDLVENPFVAGPENRLAAVAVRAVLDDVTQEHAARKYNPLLFYGATGTGKSHLVCGLAAVYRARFGAGAVAMTTAVDFARAWADAMETQSAETFRRRFTRARLLVIEDFTLLADRPAAQRELIGLVDSALALGHRVVATASLAPGQWPQILPGLQARLAGGLTVPLVPPGQAAREIILRQWAARQRIAAPETVIQTLAAAIRSSVRELSGALAALAAERETLGTAIDADAARRYVLLRKKRRTVHLREIASVTARSFGLTVTQLRSRTRRREVVTARGVAMYLARQLTGENLDQIGDYFGGRDHTTVLHGCRKTEILIETEPAVQQTVGQLRCRLQAS